MEGTLTKVCLTLTIILWINHVTFGQSMEDKQKLREKALTMINECQKKVGASDEDVEVLLSRQIPTTAKGQCLIACVFDKANMMKDGKFDKEGAVRALSSALEGNPAKIEKLKAMMDLCEKEVGEGDGDRCKMAKMLVECTAKHGGEFGFEIPHHD